MGVEIPTTNLTIGTAASGFESARCPFSRGRSIVRRLKRQVAYPVPCCRQCRFGSRAKCTTSCEIHDSIATIPFVAFGFAPFLQLTLLRVFHVSVLPGRIELLACCGIRLCACTFHVCWWWWRDPKIVSVVADIFSGSGGIHSSSAGARVVGFTPANTGARCHNKTLCHAARTTCITRHVETASHASAQYLTLSATVVPGFALFWVVW